MSGVTSAARNIARLSILLAVVACNKGSGGDLPPPGGPGTGGGSGGRSLDGGGGAGEVKVTLISPKAAEVIKGGTAPQIRATILSVRPGTGDPSGDPIEPASVEVSLRRQSDNALVVKGPLFGPLANNEYAAPFDLGNAETGDYKLIVQAATQGGATGTSSVAVRVDAGPVITIVSPKDSGSYKGGVGVHVIIDSAPFGPTMNVEGSIGAFPITLSPMGAPDNYRAQVEFIDDFPSPLDGEQIFKVSASNATGTRTDARVRFTVDNQGPVVTATEPPEGAVVGGVIRIRARVADSSGVLSRSVIAVIGNRKDVNFKIELKPDQDGFLSELFDTSRLTSCRPPPDETLCIVYPTLSFRASDLAGNESVVSYEIGSTIIRPSST
jgi:hypothetical protein